MLTNDVDLLVYEPGLFKAWWIAHQQRCRGGSGTLGGTTFTASAMDFVAAGVQAGDVLYLTSIDGVIDGCYEIIERLSATQLTISMVRGDVSEPPIAVGSGTDLAWRISTFLPQRAQGERLLSERLHLTPAAIETLSAESRRQFRTALITASLVLIFEALIQQDDDDLFERKKDVYRQLLESAICRLRLELDTTGDGRPDATFAGDNQPLKRR